MCGCHQDPRLSWQGWSKAMLLSSPPRAWGLGLTIPRPLFCTELKLPSPLPCCFIWREAGDHTGMPLPPWFEAERSGERFLVMITGSLL